MVMNSKRGGVCYNKPHFIRATRQDFEYTTYRLPGVGFRCVRVPYPGGLMCGGAWYGRSRNARASNRSCYGPTLRSRDVGFRCCVRRGYGEA